MRKRFIIVLMCALILGLVGCGQLPQILTFSVSGEVLDADGNGIAGVTVGFSGGFGTAVTDSNGKWSKDGLSGNVTVTPVKEGWVFDPESIEVTKATESRDDIDFIGADEVIVFADSDLENLVREAINKLEGDIYPFDVADLTTLDACVSELEITIEDLSGIEYLVNLRYLGLRSCGISDITPLTNLTNLTSLVLLSNEISDISSLEGLTNLTSAT